MSAIEAPHELLEGFLPLKQAYAPGGDQHAAYNVAINDSIELLSMSAIDPARPGVATRTDSYSSATRYYPSMLALQLYCESNNVLHGKDGLSIYRALPSASAGETPEVRSKRLDDALAYMVPAIYANDQQLATLKAELELPWGARIEFQTDYPFVYDALRHRALVERRVRDQSLLTRAVEKAALGALLAQKKDKIAAADAKCQQAFAKVDGDIAGAIQAAVTAAVQLVNDELFAAFIEFANTAYQELM